MLMTGIDDEGPEFVTGETATPLEVEQSSSCLLAALPRRTSQRSAWSP